MMYNGKSYHIRRRHNTVKELLSSGIITIDYVKSKDNVLEPLTKGLSREGVERISKGMSLRPRISHLGGEVPKEISNLVDLEELDLADNSFSGQLDTEIFNISGLRIIDLTDNNISGSLPPNIGCILPNIEELYLNDLTNLVGTIPHSISNCSKLNILDLAGNKLTSLIPKSLGYLTHLQILILEENNLTSDSSFSFLTSLTSCINLTLLVIYFNPLNGMLPASMGNLSTSLRTFVANSCKIQGRITNEHLGDNYLGKNQLSGSLPNCLGNITSLREIHLGSNKLSSNIPPSVGNLQDLVVLDLSSNNMKFWLCLQRSSQKWNSIAVKVFNLQLDAAFKSFDTECEVLSSLRHRNLIKVITSCSNLDFKALVLEYMPNGSLEKYLYSHNYFLDIFQRLSIMIDVACALEYLHHGCSSPVIHCDLKLSNVLLDEDMISHLSDFSISKLLGENESNLYTKTFATLGYIAPEYGLDGLVSTKCDVYSYGIMLLETFTRRRPNEFEGDLSLKQWVSYSLPEALMDVVDVNLVKSMGNRFQKELDLVASIMKVALDCCAESPAGRTNMMM
ncbi:hypothetical protein CQW23_30158 [Capsicum baccatum]|uniref:non-specific serine/threonine protein kinase n=1 Tax=Capsicum baccatum TaxID=33114 RepID=A0A2G2VBC5_CAPBA|nr:hypothetical protein CQW23_30158 [Capsicum baccatum]